jgi:hypothetical protein
MTARTAGVGTAMAIALALGVATGCGVDSNDAPPPNQTVAVTATSTTTTRTVTTTPLPTRPEGTIAIDTLVGDNVSGGAISGYTGQSGNRVVGNRGTDNNNFAALCSGKVDAITSTGEPNAATLAACKRRGLTIVNPLPLGSDGIVLATKNQSDVGGDCITVAQARDIYKAGSTYTNWNQLGFFDLPLRTTGREAGSDGFRLFGQIVLGIPNPTAGDVRADYVAKTTDDAERETITGAAVRRAALRRVRAHVKHIAPTVKKNRTTYVNKAIALANARVLKIIDKVNAENKRKKVIVNGPALIKHNARLVASAKQTAAARATLRFNSVVARQLSDYTKRALRGTGQRGFIGPFNFSYYGVYEEQLRPMEVDFGVPETQSGQPVQFQDLTPAAQAALAPQIAKATGQTTPNPAAVKPPTTTTTTTVNKSKSATATTTTTTPATPQPAYIIDPTTIVPNLNDLPATTADGQTIYSGPNCVFPSALTITNGAYPLTRRLFIYTTSAALKRQAVRSFLTYVVENAQSLATRVNLVPITDIQREQALAEIQGKTAPKAQSLNGGEATTTTTTPTTTVPRTTTSAAPTQTTQTTTTPANGGGGVPGVSSRTG